MRRYDYNISVGLIKIMEKGQRHYTAASVDALIDRLERYQSIIITRRTYFRVVKSLVDGDILIRKVRYARTIDDEIMQLPSLFVFTRRGLKWLASLGNMAAVAMLRLLNRWLAGKNGRWPSAKHVSSVAEAEAPPVERDRVKERELAGVNIKSILAMLEAKDRSGKFGPAVIGPVGI